MGSEMCIRDRAATDVAVGRQGAVTSAAPEATAIGLAVLQKGGNAVDAAVAVAFALGVAHPTAGNIGGGGFLVIRTPAGLVTSLDYRETAPGAATADMYLDAKGDPTRDSRIGPRAAGIPGDVAGMALAHKRFGKLPWKDLVMPAVALARDGFVLDSFHAEDMQWGAKSMGDYLAQLEADPKANPALREAVRKTVALFRRPDGTPLAQGDRWVQPELAKTLEAIAKGGAKAFYRGRLAARMAKEVKAMGGIWTAKDLAGYKVLERKPVTFDYRGHQVFTMAPPSAGGITLRQVLAASETLNFQKLTWTSVERIHLYAEALRRIYADRNLLVADPDFAKVPMDRLLDATYIAARLGTIDPERATPSSKISAGVELEEKPETTHFSVVDGAGLAVANTFTLNGGFGAKVLIPGTGVMLNNEMDDFTAKPGTPNMFGLVQGPQNAVAPGKRMLSSMTPTILAKDGQPFLVLGSPGGRTIINSVLLAILNVVDFGMNVQEAVDAPRFHHQWLPDRLDHEPFAFSPDTAHLLAGRGHALRATRRQGVVNAILWDAQAKVMEGASDRRSPDGAAIGR